MNHHQADEVRVLVWEEFFWPRMGGVEVLAAKLLPALQARGYRFLVVTRRDGDDLPPEDVYQGIRVARFPFWTAFSDIAQLMTLKREITSLKRSFAPHLIHVNGFGPSVVFHQDTLTAHRAPVLFTLHTERPEREFGEGKLLERVVRSASWINGCAPKVVEHFCALMPELADRTSVIYNGLDVPTESPTPLPSNPRRLLCLGRLSEEKRFEIAIEAYARVRDQLGPTRLSIVGEGPTRPELERLVATYGIGDTTDFLGWIAPEHVPGLLNECTAVVMPSRVEGLPLVALEAGLMCRPVIGSHVAGLAEVIEHERTGLLVEPESVEGFAEAIKRLMTDHDFASRLGVAARERIRTTFGLPRCVDAYDTLYQKLVGVSDNVGRSP